MSYRHMARIGVQVLGLSRIQAAERREWGIRALTALDYVGARASSSQFQGAGIAVRWHPRMYAIQEPLHHVCSSVCGWQL